MSDRGDSRTAQATPGLVNIKGHTDSAKLNFMNLYPIDKAHGNLRALKVLIWVIGGLSLTPKV